MAVDLGSLRWWSTVVVVGANESSEEQRWRAVDLARKSGDGASMGSAGLMDGLCGPFNGVAVFLFS